MQDQSNLADLASEIKIATLELRRFEKDTFLNIEDGKKRDDYADKWSKEAEQLSQLLARTEAALPSADKGRAARMTELFRAYENGYRQVLRGQSDGTYTTPQQCNAKISEFKAQIHELEDLAGALHEDYQEQMAQQVPVISTLVGRTALTIFLVTLIALGGSIPLTIMLTRGITRPIGRVVEAARALSSGQVAVALDQEKRGDEIGELNASFSEMVVYLQDMSAISARIAQGDLAVEVKPRSADDRLSLAFLEMTSGLRKMVKSVRDAAAQVASGSAQGAQASSEAAQMGVRASSSIEEVTSTMHEMSTNTQSMLRNTQGQASSVRETSASIEQMVVSIQRVDEHLRKLVEVSRRSGEEVQTGIATTEKASQGLDRVRASILSSAEIITLLGDRADNIGKIIDVIDDISEQTNLLALNAAIEAARAGENGLGFSVVADEVRKLAEKSASSTKEISELIQSIQKESRNAIRNMEQNTAVVNESMALGSNVSKALSQIASVVSDVDKLAREIGSATAEQSSGSTQIAAATSKLNEITHEISSAVEEQTAGTQTVVKTMERMHEVVQQSSSSASELAASAEQMTRMARLMVESTDRFKLDREPQGAPRNETHGAGRGNGHGNRHGVLPAGEVQRYAAEVGSCN